MRLDSIEGDIEHGRDLALGQLAAQQPKHCKPALGELPLPVGGTNTVSRVTASRGRSARVVFSIRSNCRGSLSGSGPRAELASWQAPLQAVKNAAYAWRQAIYFLSLCETPAQAEALAPLRGQVRAVGKDFQSRLGPAVDGLAHVIAGGRFDAVGIASEPGSGRRFLGWSETARTGSSSRLIPGYATDGPPVGSQA